MTEETITISLKDYERLVKQAGRLAWLARSCWGG